MTWFVLPLEIRTFRAFSNAEWVHPALMELSVSPAAVVE
jgi:hypothetical protein